jgi:hypothetical protein
VRAPYGLTYGAVAASATTTNAIPVKTSRARVLRLVTKHLPWRIDARASAPFQTGTCHEVITAVGGASPSSGFGYPGVGADRNGLDPQLGSRGQIDGMPDGAVRSPNADMACINW